MLLSVLVSINFISLPTPSMINSIEFFVVPLENEAIFLLTDPPLTYVGYDVEFTFTGGVAVVCSSKVFVVLLATVKDMLLTWAIWD